MITRHCLLSLFAVALLQGCGGSHAIGNEPACSDNIRCPTGSTCAQGVCVQEQCSATRACPLRQACVSGACQSIGAQCAGGQCTGASETCDQGVCRVWCGSNYPNNFCATGETCQNSVCRP